MRIIEKLKVNILFVICLLFYSHVYGQYGSDPLSPYQRNLNKRNFTTTEYIYELEVKAYVNSSHWQTWILYFDNSSDYNSAARSLKSAGLQVQNNGQIRNPNYESQQSSSTTPRDTYTPPPPKFIYKGVEYSTKAAMDAAIKEEERKNFLTNVKPEIDAGFREINPTSNTSNPRQINSTNNTSSGFREIGQSTSMNSSPRPQVSPPIETTITKKEKSERVTTNQNKSDFSNPQILYQSKGAYHGVLQSLAESKGLNVTNYFSEADWNDCTQDSKIFFSPRCENFHQEYNRFWRDIYGADNLLGMNDEQKKELIDMGIDVAENYLSVSAGVAASIFGTPVAGAAASGAIKAGSEIFKDINHGKSIDDPKVWWNATVSGIGAGAGSLVKFKVVDGAGWIVNGKNFLTVVTLKGAIAGTTERVKGKSPEEARKKGIRATVKSTIAGVAGTSETVHEYYLSPFIGVGLNIAEKSIPDNSKNTNDNNKSQKH